MTRSTPYPARRRILPRRGACRAGLAVVLGCLPVVSVLAKPPLSAVPEIENRLFAAAIAHEVSENCDRIAARRMKAITMAWQLRARANDLGYSDAEIRAHVESDSEKARMRRKGETFLKQNGVSYGNPETFCAFGRAEIAKSSAIGALLKAR